MFFEKIKKELRLIFKFAIIDMKRKFKSSILSWFWLIIAPLMMLFMYWFAFSSSGSNTNEIQYTINGHEYNFKWIAWIIIGSFSWTYFGDIIVSGPYAIKNYHWMYKSFGIRFYIPTIIVNVSKFIVGLGLLIVAWLISIICNATDGNPETLPLSIYSLEVPLMFILIFSFMLGWSYCLSHFVGISRDFQNLIFVLPMLLSWVSGVFLQPNSIGAGNDAVNIILQINPFNFMINGLRSTMLGYSEIFSPNMYCEWYSILSFFLWLILFWLVGLLLSKKTGKFIVDIV